MVSLYNETVMPKAFPWHKVFMKYTHRYNGKTSVIGSLHIWHRPITWLHIWQAECPHEKTIFWWSLVRHIEQLRESWSSWFRSCRVSICRRCSSRSDSNSSTRCCSLCCCCCWCVCVVTNSSIRCFCCVFVVNNSSIRSLYRRSCSSPGCRASVRRSCSAHGGRSVNKYNMLQ